MRREISLLSFVFVPKKEINNLSSFFWVKTEKKKTKNDLKEQHNVIMFYFVYMWQTLPPV